MASSPAVAGFANGVYRVLVVAPATSNSVAKFVYGISDSLVSNLFAQAGKSRVPIIVLPTDVAPEVDSPGPHGDLIKVYPRPIDLQNTDMLRHFSGRDRGHQHGGNGAMPRYLFVTGKLAAQSLASTLEKMSPDFEYEVAVLPISVAALMDTHFVAKHLDSARGSDVIMIPGLCKGDLSI